MINDNNSQFDRLVSIIEKLRAKDGCPWDREQTHESLKKACLEEAAEVVCGINIFTDTGNADNLREELGDLLLQVVMHAQIAKEEGLFTMEDVCRDIADKMVRRHPHVFPVQDDEISNALTAAPDKVTTADQVLANWDEIKKVEHKSDDLDVNTYLFKAFDESKELIDAAIKRKKEKFCPADQSTQ